MGRGARVRHLPLGHLTGAGEGVLGSDLPVLRPQRLADAAETFQKAHRWQDNIKVRTAPSQPSTCPPPGALHSGSQSLCSPQGRVLLWASGSPCDKGLAGAAAACQLGRGA